MRFGFHVSIGGGLRNAVTEARARKCEAIQIFSRNPQGWQLKELDPDDVADFRSGIRDAGICPVAIHMPYLPNLAAENSELWEKSIEATAIDLTRAQMIGAQYVVTHMGRRKEASEAEGLKRMIIAIDRALESSGGQTPTADRPKLLLENTAGMGGSLGYRFEHLQTVIDGAKHSNRLGVVLDTAHAFEAGYEFRSKDGLDRTLREFDATVGLKRLHLLHLNDSRTEFGSRVDRHWHIGKGNIGKEGFRNIVNHPLLRHLPGVMETPRLGLKEDMANLRVIRSLERRMAGPAAQPGVRVGRKLKS
jgi:deoxyribonuclease IV